MEYDTRPMRIVIVSQTYLPGNNGQAIFTIHLAEGLARAGNEVHMILPNDRFRYTCEVVNGVTLHKVRSLRFNWIHPDTGLGFMVVGQIRGILRRVRPEVIHFQDHYFLSRDVLLAAAGMDIPMVGTNHFLPENVLPYLHILPFPREWKIKVLWALMLWTYNRLQQVTTPTETAARILRGTGIHPPVTAISCGVDTGFFQPAGNGLDRAAVCQEYNLDPEKVLFLYLGRLDREKRIDLLLQGIARLAREGRGDVQLAVAGKGAAEAELRALARTLGLEGMVRFLGYIPNQNLPFLYQVADIFTMPSPEELQSIATLEAMASGKPVLAANARALPELVTTQANGYLFEAGSAEDVARGMAYLAGHRAEWASMGQVSRARAQAHSLENTIRRYEQVYRMVVKGRRSDLNQ